MKKELHEFSKEFLELHEDSSFNNAFINKNLEEDDDMRVINEGVKKKKEKKKEKKKKKKRSFMDDKIDLLMDDIEMDNELKTSDSIAMDDDDDYLIFKKGKKGKKKDLFDVKKARKDKKKNIEAKFNPQLMELRKILKDSNDASVMIRGILEEIRGSKSRYVGKTLTDLLQALNSANSNRASIVRDISNIQKTIIDLGIKKDKANPKKKDEESDSEEYGINLFQRILSGNGGRKDMMKSAKKFFDESENRYEGDDEYEDPDEVINRRLNEEENSHRSENGSKYIEYEKDGAEDCVMVFPDGSWEPDAVDKYNSRMPEDYPRMKKEDMPGLRLDLDTKVATDEYGRKFKIVESI